MWHVTIVAMMQKETQDRRRVMCTEEKSAGVEQKPKWNGTDAQKGQNIKQVHSKLQ